MSETIETPPDVAAARAAKAAKIEARIAELKQSEGKWYVRKDGKGLPTKVVKYAGIFIKDGVGIYTFAVETPGHASWNAPATDFLAAHNETSAPASTATADEPI